MFRIQTLSHNSLRRNRLDTVMCCHGAARVTLAGPLQFKKSLLNNLSVYCLTRLSVGYCYERPDVILIVQKNE